MDFKSILKSVAVLTAICLLSAVILAVANVFLVTPRSSEIDLEVKKQIALIAQGSSSFGDVDISLDDNEEVINVVKVLNGTHKDSYILRTEALGYKDPIQVITLVDTNKTVQGVLIHSVGNLDDRYESAVKAKKLEIEEWFIGKKQSDLTLGAGAGKTAKAINDAVGVTTAASMTTNGFVTGVYYALDFVTKNSSDLASADTVEIDFTGVDVVIPVRAEEMIFTAQELTTDEKSKLATAGFDMSVATNYVSMEFDFGKGLPADAQAEREAARDEAQALMAEIYGIYNFKAVNGGTAVILGASADETSIVAMAYAYTKSDAKTEIVLKGADSGAAYEEAKKNAEDWYEDNKALFQTVEHTWEESLVSSFSSRLSTLGYGSLNKVTVEFAGTSDRDDATVGIRGAYKLGNNNIIVVSKTFGSGFGENTVVVAEFTTSGSCVAIKVVQSLGFQDNHEQLTDAWFEALLATNLADKWVTGGNINSMTDTSVFATSAETLPAVKQCVNGIKTFVSNDSVKASLFS